ncbi:hypothetical protein D4R87_02160 [bacterium]|nr:MAG: hypothetical protein D4R87_02160 [bacterium]
MFNTFYKKLILFTGITVFALLFFAARKESDKNKQIRENVRQLEEKILSLKQEETSLAGLIEFFQTADFKEREIKQQLGMQNPDEKVIVITQDNNPELQHSDEENNQPENNLTKWWNFIFNN